MTVLEKQPSPELLSLIKAAAQSLLGFGELWNSIKKKGKDEGFSERELQDILRPLLKPQLNKDQIYYLFNAETKIEKVKDYQSRRKFPTNAGNNVILNDEKTFQKTRLEALARDNNQCTICGTTDDLQIHHKKHNVGIGLDHSLDNLQTLCRKCHSKITRSNSADSPHRPHLEQSQEEALKEEEDFEEWHKQKDNVPVKTSEQFYQEQQKEEDPKDTEIDFLKEKVTELEDALKKMEQFKPATALEGKRLSLDETAVFEFLAKRDNGVTCYWYPNYGIDLVPSRILKDLKNRGVKMFKRLYFEV